MSLTTPQQRFEWATARSPHPAWRLPDGRTPFATGERHALLVDFYEPFKGYEGQEGRCPECRCVIGRDYGSVGDLVVIRSMQGPYPVVASERTGMEFEADLHELMPFSALPRSWPEEDGLELPALTRDIRLDFSRVEQHAKIEGQIWGLHFANPHELQAAWENVLNPEHSGGDWLFLKSVREVVDKCVHAHQSCLALRSGDRTARRAWFRGFGAGAAKVLKAVIGGR